MSSDATEDVTDSKSKPSTDSTSNVSSSKKPEASALLKLMQTGGRDWYLYILIPIGGLLMIGGSLLPWFRQTKSFFTSLLETVLSESDPDRAESLGLLARFLDSLFATPSRSIAEAVGVGRFGFGYGIIMFILGVLLFAGLFDKPFGIPKKLYVSTIGFAGVAIVLAAIFDNTLLDFKESYGLYIALAGTSLIAGQGFRIINSKEKATFGFNSKISKCNMLNIGGLLIIALVATLSFNYASKIPLESLSQLIQADESNPTSALSNLNPDSLFDLTKGIKLFSPEYRVLGILTVLLIAALFALVVAGRVLNINSKQKKEMPAAPFLLFSLGLMTLHTPFIFRILTPQAASTVPLSSPGAEAANWVIFICAAIIFAISVHSVRAGAKS